MSFASRGKSIWSSTSSAARSSIEVAAAAARMTVESAAVAAKVSSENVAAAARSSVSSAAAAARSAVDNVDAFNSDGGVAASMPLKSEDSVNPCLAPRIAYLAVTRNEDLLAEFADAAIGEEERNFSIALGRKMIKRKVAVGWDELSSKRLHSARFPVHDVSGYTSYILCFNYAVPRDHVESFAQRMSLMLDPMVERVDSCSISKRDEIDSTLSLLLERELERGNLGNAMYNGKSHVHEIRGIFLQNVETILDREDKVSEGEEKNSQLGQVTSMVKNKTRSLRRMNLMNQVKWRVTLGIPRRDAVGEADASTQKQTAKATPAPAASAPAELNFWECAACTFKSKTSVKHCEICETARFAEESSERATGQVGASSDLPVPETTSNPLAEAQPAASKPALPPRPPEPPSRPHTPRARARILIGNRMSAEQAARAAELIIALQPFVDGRRASLDDIWGFFDMTKPPGHSFKESDHVARSLRSKLNRLRLLLHPDKNGHPDAERTFKFLEQCNQRITDSYVARDRGRKETVAERTRREERELREEQERRRKQEEEFRLAEERRQQEEDKRVQEEEQQARKADGERERLEKMLRYKEALGQSQMQRIARQRVPPAANVQETSGSGGIVPLSSRDDEIEDSDLLDALPSIPPRSEPIHPIHPSEPVHAIGASGDQRRSTCTLPSVTEEKACPADSPVGKLTLTILSARDLPASGLFSQTDAYAIAIAGRSRQRTPSVPGRSPAFGCTFEFEIFAEDQELRITVWREGWGYSLLGDDFVGMVVIPFLDLEDWSSCVIGRMLEAADPEAADFMQIELRASIEWF